MISSRIKDIIRNPFEIFFILGHRGLLNYLTDEKYLRIGYYIRFKKKLDLESPQSFNMKIQWLKLNDRCAFYTNVVDKYEVRKYISKKLGDKYLIDLLGVWDEFDDIDFSKLPNEFVLKCTHDSGGIIICKDKSKFNKNKARKKINKCLITNYYYGSREWPYKNVKPRIICEKYMVDESDTELKDYKFMCFNGKVKCSFVCLNRDTSIGLNVDFYDLDWRPMPFERHYPKSGTLISKPQNYNMMIEFAEKLSQDIPFVRVDFYEVSGRIYFGELTFYPGSGFEEFTPESYDFLLGSWLELHKNKSN